jgi:hypothetical protein
MELKSAGRLRPNPVTQHPSKGGTQCPHCKQILGAGPTKQFAEFVESFIPGGAVPEAERKRFYRVRSALSHGGKLLSADHGAWGFTPKQLGEGSDSRAVWQIVQLVLLAHRAITSRSYPTLPFLSNTISMCWLCQTPKRALLQPDCSSYSWVILQASTQQWFERR